MANPPRFTAEQTPSEILNAAGHWLAGELGDFRWVKTRQTVSRRRGAHTEELRLQPSRWNRAGLGTWANLTASLRSGDLARWRGGHPDDTLLLHDRDLVWSSPFMNVDASLYFVDLFGDPQEVPPGVRGLTLLELLEGTRTVLLPIFALFDSPQSVARRLPDAWLLCSPSLVEWALSLGDRSAAREITVRAMRADIGAGEAFAGGRAQFERGQRPPSFRFDKQALGWLSARHGLFRHGEPLPWTLPPASEQEAVIAAGRELAERLRSELRHFQETRPGCLSDGQLSQVLDRLQSWLRELSGQVTLAQPAPDQALRDCVSEFGIARTDLGGRLVAFESDAARLRRGKGA